MSKETLDFPLTEAQYKHIQAERDQIVAKLRENKIELLPNGTFVGKMTGTMDIQPHRLTISITDKPFLWPMGIIEATIKKALL